MMKSCCANCIGDRGITRAIIPTLSSEVGNCLYCGTQNTQLIQLSFLKSYFEQLANIYIKNQTGKTLVEWFKDDWDMFSHPTMDIAHSKELLADILDDGAIVRENFIPSDDCLSDGLERWEKLRSELMYENRFFPQTEIDAERLHGLLSHLLLGSDELNEIWYRARLQTMTEPFLPDDMGAPPKHLASQGRANPAGIPYLYLASTVTTAISELRPHTGDFASVADYCMSKNLKIIDLRFPRKTVSPFLLSDEREVALLRGDISFLEQLGDELTRPVLPLVAAIDYIPSQYICEFIKKCGYHGVIYKSSVGDGINLAVFDPNIASALNVARYKVSRVSVEVSQ